MSNTNAQSGGINMFRRSAYLIDMPYHTPA